MSVPLSVDHSAVIVGGQCAECARCDGGPAGWRIGPALGIRVSTILVRNGGRDSFCMYNIISETDVNIVL